jgi:adenylate cyclase
MHFREPAVRVVGSARHLPERGEDVRRMGNRSRITVQPIDAATGEHVWPERYDRDQADLFALQDEIVGTVGATLAGRLQAAGIRQARRKPPSTLAAYESVPCGRSLSVGAAETEAEARRWYERALELDPDYAQAHAHLAYMLTLEWFRDASGSDALLDHALVLARTAVALDAGDPLCHDRLGWVHLHRKEFDPAEQHKLRALELVLPNGRASGAMA